MFVLMAIYMCIRTFFLQQGLEVKILEVHAKLKILALMDNLQKTDYKAIKYAEGLLTAEEYAPIKAERQAMRDEINRLEAELAGVAE